MKKINVGSTDLCTLTWHNRDLFRPWRTPLHHPHGMTPLIGVTLEDLAPGVERTMAEMVGTHSWEMAGRGAASEAATTAEKAGTRDSAWFKCGGETHLGTHCISLKNKKIQKTKKKKKRGGGEKMNTRRS
ncbi:unnamed protein product [Cuscuta europaea]|uniref:Uncharacterized protein n=1 Tax=Cuscuta europaea TaxID=41803 RepID=A0A9P0Z7Y3_CUSEU|nr:unnamed protein product [Cuscuta europaea]